MKFELKAIKTMPSISEETLAFSATVYVDGKKVGTASNRGHGDPVDLRVPRDLYDAINDAARRSGIDAFADWDDYTTGWQARSNDSVILPKPTTGIDDIITMMIASADDAKTAKRLQGKIGYIPKGSRLGQYVTYKGTPASMPPAVLDRIRSKEDFTRFLHEMTVEDIVEKLFGRTYQPPSFTA